ncbi:hypothetical protein CC78DRAFT_621326 [Lojkania enalia]|uniref:Cupin type-1 domain-containing protein n=1 Tax=Lojkania enalia TaxID=147567 RepID=A0A9P4K2R1_9PLEO|nr:hypothetical protein CC78DRAFT_621326 [Didymosphaeria enalia]
MPTTISKAFVAALAFGAVYALPQSRTPAPRAAAPSDNTELIADLVTDPTVIKRYRRLLTDAGQQLLSGEDLAKATIFDFQKDPIPVRGSQGGVTTSSDTETFPILFGSDIMMNWATLGPCGILLPHVHPRANEFFVVSEGEVEFGYMLEIGLLKTQAPSPEINGKLTKYTGTLFPQGSIHYQINNSPECKPATILATLSSSDPGTTTILQTPPVGNATVSMQADRNDIDYVRPLLPPQIVSVLDKCLARCNAGKV